MIIYTHMFMHVYKHIFAFQGLGCEQVISEDQNKCKAVCVCVLLQFLDRIPCAALHGEGEGHLKSGPGSRDGSQNHWEPHSCPRIK